MLTLKITHNKRNSVLGLDFTTSDLANRNLKSLDAKDEQIFFTGNVMIDTLLKNKPRFTKPAIWQELDLREKEYLVMTLHGPANVDEEEKLKALMDEIIKNSRDLPLIFPVH